MPYLQILGLSPAARPPRGETPRMGCWAAVARLGRLQPEPVDGADRRARQRLLAPSARSAPAAHPRSFGSDAVLEGTPTTTALCSCNGLPFYRERQALRPFPMVVVPVSRLRLPFPRSERGCSM